ncbi:MAG TPA: histidine kinase dimerization/phospho-acceptor domain-containing protein [Gemmatimonadota bacterium]|jgi:signal transduction histidine kinase
MREIAEGVLLYDAEGRLLFANGPARALAGADAAGAPEADVLARVGAFLESASDIPAWVAEALRAADEPAAGEVRVRAGAGERAFLATPHRIRSPRGLDGLLLLLTDVEALEQARAGAQCHVTLDHVRLAAELMAHRFRNPLNAIVLVLELARRKLAGQAEPLKNLDTIQSEVQRLEVRLQHFLDMVRRREHRPGTVDLVSVVESVCELLHAPARDARVTLSQQLGAASALARADEVELLRALLGPCAVAIRESPPGGEVKVRLDSGGRDYQVVVECPGVQPGSVALGVAEELVAKNGGALTYDPRNPVRLVYRFRAEPAAEPPAR